MAWFRTGTISLTNGSTAVTGSGTTWIANAGIGEALYAPDGRLYEIANIASDTRITLASPYLGANASGQTYVIVPSQSYIRDLAAQAADLVNNYSTIANTIGVGKFPDGTLSDLAFKFGDDLDTGFFRSATNEVTFVAGGVAQFKYGTAGITFIGGSGLDLTTLKIGGVTVTSTAAELNILDGATVTVSELNVLDGLTASTTELNYVDGVTSGIQVQLNSKSPTSSPTFTGTASFDVIKANFITAENILTVGSFTWDSATSSPAAVAGGQAAPVVTAVHKQMKGCVLNTDGTVNYYLDATDWTKKADGTASDLTGTDGNVMIEIPKFWYQTIYVTTKPTWRISSVSASGFLVHPAFIKDGVEVDFRYYGAYDACVLDVSSSPQQYISGLNYDNNDGGNGVGVNVTASTGDKLASVKGIYPMVGLTRTEFRTLASNVGTGWRQLDFHLWSAVQMLYLIENQSFFSQSILGAGNTNGSYLAPSANQTDSPHTIAGAGDSIANGSTNTTSGAGVNVKPGTSFMKYRGIENFYGNCWNWADGINVNIGTAGTVYMTNNATNWADNTSTNYDLITSSLPTASGYISDLLPADPYMLPETNSGGSTTYITDYHFASVSTNRVVRVGGFANAGAIAGAFCLVSSDASFGAGRDSGGRLAF